MKLGRWSTTTAGNAVASPNGFVEGALPSTINDCMREMMASIRTVFLDPQFVDQDLSPTFSTTTKFTIPGDQTSLMTAARRVKLFDTSSMFATVLSSTYVNPTTTVTIATDTGQNLTNSLTSFAVSIFDTKSWPKALWSTTYAPNIPKAWVRFSAVGGVAGTSGVASVVASFNVSSVSLSGSSGCRVNFTTPFVDSAYAVVAKSFNSNTVTFDWPYQASAQAASYKVYFRTALLIAGHVTFQDDVNVHATLTFYHA